MDEEANHVFQRDIADRALFVRQTDEAVECGRQTQESRHRLTAIDAIELQAHRKSQIGDEWERMRRIDRQGRQNRENQCFEFVFQPDQILFGKCGRTNDIDVFLAQILLENRKRSLLLHLEIVDLFQNILKLLGGVFPSGVLTVTDWRT